jgi:16S rRNA processing protein RimM
MDPADVAAYGPLCDETGEPTFELRVVGRAKGNVIARLAGVDDRDAAEALKSRRLYVPRTALPEAGEEEYYYDDLVGLRARLVDGDELGTVRAVHDFGAGAVVEIENAVGDAVMVPFTRAAVPEVDLAGGSMVIDPQPGLLDGPETPPTEAVGNENEA